MPLQTKTSVPTERQRLLFRGRMLRNAEPLSSYSVQDGHTLLLAARPVDLPMSPLRAPLSSVRMLHTGAVT